MKITKSTINRIYRAKKATVETMELQGYELVENLFVDSSGLGQEDEPALTVNAFEKKVNELLDEYGELTAKVTGVGQFQIYMGLFKRVRRGIITRISPSVFERIEGDKKIIRLYDTDIVTLHKDYIILDTGGFSTRTTHKWMNKYILKGHVYAKNFQSYYGDKLIIDGQKIPLK